MARTPHTPGPWQYVPSTDHHGPYITTGADFTYGDIADFYVMSKPDWPSTLNGGPSKPVPHQGDAADANARLAAAAPDLLSIAQRWAALDGGSWHVQRYAREREELLADTRAVIAKAEGAVETPSARKPVADEEIVF
jgi:hypothetical protein